VRRAVYKSAIEFWLEKGIDGFRVDVVNLYSKHQDFPDADVTVEGEIYQSAMQHTVNGPRMHEFLKEQRKEALDRYGDVVLVGELGHTRAEEVLRYIGKEARELDMVFDFDMVGLGGRFDVEPHKTWKHTLPEFKDAVLKVQKFLETDAWATVFAENHDNGRSLSRFATDDPKWRIKAAKMLSICLSTLSGTLFLYQGQEIGMVNHPVTWAAEDLQDVAAVNYIASIKERYPGDEKMLADALAGLQRVGRDNARTPVHWSAEEYAGFSAVKPWMRVLDDYKEINVASQLHDPDSVLSAWKKCLRVRKEHSDVLVHGRFEVFDQGNEKTFTFGKVYEEKTVLVVLNFSAEEQAWEIPSSMEEGKLRVLMSNVDGLGEKLSPWEGRAYLVE
jgi:oligo-1,6-glucosidase